MDQLVNTLLGIMTSVSILVLISIGLAVIFGMMGIINFAHGTFLMLGAFFTVTAVRTGLNFWPAAVLATLAMGVFGLFVERVLIRHLYGRLEATMLATFGLALILEQAAVLIWGTSSTGISTPLSNFRIGDYSFSEYEISLIAIAALLLLITYLVFTRTRFGIMARATNQNSEMASALGINARGINSGTFACGAALAGAGGAALAPIVAVSPSMGSAYIANAFMTVVVGGPAVVTGTSVSAALLGTVQRLVSDRTSVVLGAVALLVLAIVILRVMPEGISGRLRRTL
jgi:branched-subunit amino acid ABC-type transport system permease component